MSGRGEEKLRYGVEMVTWLVVLGGVALTFALAYVPMGPWNIVVAIAIAAVQALIVAAIFMELRKPKTLMRMAAGTALIFLGILFVLSFSDYFNRALELKGELKPVEIPINKTGGRH